MALIPVMALILAACSGAGAGNASPSSPPGAAGASASTTAPTSLTIYAAASLSGVLDRVRTVYRAANPGTTLTISTGSSAALETQIEQGAPADVFLSADTTNPQKLVAEGLVDGAAVPFAGNRLTIIVPSANPAGIRTPADLARPGVRVIAAGDSVPITTYALRLVSNLARQPGYPADFAARYAANIVSKEEDVAAVVAKLALGEGDAGIAYVTDARTSTKVATVAVPESANVPATYDGVVLKASKQVDAAHAFLAWLAGPNGQAVLGDFGFVPPP